MDSELNFVKTQIAELKSELEFERKVRKKVEHTNKKLAKELFEERQSKEAVERMCEELAKEIASDKAEIDRMKREMEEERKMMRMAEVLREERVQIKLSEAKILFEEKLLELEFSKGVQVETSETQAEKKEQEKDPLAKTTTNDSTAMDSNGNSNSADNCGGVRWTANHRRTSPEAENPHIKRGIKGFVEFPRVVRAIGSKGRHLSSKLECQKAQLRLLLRHKNPIRADNLIMG